LNIGQFSSAENDVNVLINTSIELVTSISQTCSTLAQQEQRIIIENTIGSVVIENNLFEQVLNLFQTCLQTSISNSEALQAIVLKLQQDSSATSQGLSEWALVAILALLIGAPTVGALVIGKEILDYMFPILLIAGVVMIIVYYYTKKQSIPIKAYSTFIENTPACLSVPTTQNPVFDFKTVESAGNYCMNKSDCMAYDWKGLNITQSGNYSFVDPPQSKFYTSVSSDCRTSITEDNVNMIRSPSIHVGEGSPPAQITGLHSGDCWIDTKTSNWYQLVNNWILKDVLVKNSFTKLTIQDKQPDSTQTGIIGEIVIVYTETDPGNFKIYSYDGTWQIKQPVTGPGFFSDSPSVVNASGIKEKIGTDWLLYGGIGAIIVGAGGTVINAIVKSKKKA
jgi:hypothetical protein